MQNLYEILGIKRDATQNQVKKAYHRLAKKYHPDKNKVDDDAKIIEINLAYEILKDPESRKEYDITGIVTTQKEFNAEVDKTLAVYFKQALAEKEITGKRLVAAVSEFAKIQIEESNQILHKQEKHLLHLNIVKDEKYRGIDDRKPLGYAVDESITETEAEIYKIKRVKKINRAVIDRLSEKYSDEDDEVLVQRRFRQSTTIMNSTWT
jgi:curved DNA-binding protein CbpA